jgi:hypothetical protein
VVRERRRLGGLSHRLPANRRKATLALKFSKAFAQSCYLVFTPGVEHRFGCTPRGLARGLCNGFLNRDQLATRERREVDICVGYTELKRGRLPGFELFNRDAQLPR